MNRLRKLAPDLFVVDQPLSFFGLPLGARMTIVRLPGQKLWLHSPTTHSSALEAEVSRLGTPSHLVAPNCFHHLSIGAWKSAFPKAVLHAAPGLAAKRPDLAIDATLGGDVHPDWSPALEQIALAAIPILNEVVFFHRPTATLVASDLVFNVGRNHSRITRLAFRLIGRVDRPSTTLVERLLVRDREAFRGSLLRILDWPIERIILAHGDVFEGDGRGALREAYDWLLA